MLLQSYLCKHTSQTHGSSLACIENLPRYIANFEGQLRTARLTRGALVTTLGRSLADLFLATERGLIGMKTLNALKALCESSHIT